MALTTAQAAQIVLEIARCDRLLKKLWADDAREEVLRRRRSLLRLLHDVPQGFQLPLDWQPPAHPQTANLTGEFRT
jgi:hypothetical protein